jgi:2-aminoadipate transaminase
MAVAKQYVDCATNTPAQYVFLEYLRRGLLDRRLRSILDHYRAKRDFILAQLERHMTPEVSWNRPAGGFFIFVRLPSGLDAGELSQEAIEHNVAFVAGSSFFVDGGGRDTLRLSFSQAGRTEMAAAVGELGTLIRLKSSLRSKPPKPVGPELNTSTSSTKNG